MTVPPAELSFDAKIPGLPAEVVVRRRIVTG